MVTTEQLRAIMPGAKQSSLDSFTDPLNAAMAEFGIDTPARQAMFIAQIAHETGQLRWIVELWGPTSQQQRYDPPDNLAKTLGNVTPGDGRRYRGRGTLQITGRANYATYGAGLGLDAVTNPEMLELPLHASRVGALYWERKGLNDYADDGDIIMCTRKINGGLNGLADRTAFWEKAKEVLGV